MPPGGFRLAVINDFSLNELRENLERSWKLVCVGACMRVGVWRAGCMRVWRIIRAVIYDHPY